MRAGGKGKNAWTCDGGDQSWKRHRAVDRRLRRGADWRIPMGILGLGHLRRLDPRRDWGDAPGNESESGWEREHRGRGMAKDMVGYRPNIRQ